MAALTKPIMQPEDEFSSSVIQAACRETVVTEAVLPEQANRIIIDCFRASFPTDRFEEVKHLIKNEFDRDWKESKPPKEQHATYRKSLRCGNVRLYFDNRWNNDAFALEFTGKSNPTEHINLLQRLVKLGGKAQRIDITFDDHSAIVTIRNIVEAIKSGNCVTRFKSAKPIESYSPSTGQKTGNGIMFGSRESDSCVRIYDKGLEQGGDSDSHIRHEVELKSTEAQDFVSEFICMDKDTPVYSNDFPNDGLLEHFKSCALTVLKTKMSFRDRSSARNVSRTKMLPWWKELLEYFDEDTEIDANEEKQRAFTQWLSEEDHELLPTSEAYKIFESEYLPPLNIPDYEDASLTHKEKTTEKAARSIISELYGEFKKGTGGFDTLSAALRGETFTPTLRVVSSNEAPAIKQSSPPLLKLVANNTS